MMPQRLERRVWLPLVQERRSRTACGFLLLRLELNSDNFPWLDGWTPIHAKLV